jgi:hypothetical protein
LMSNRDIFRRDGVHLNVNGTCKFFRSLYCCSSSRSLNVFILFTFSNSCGRNRYFSCNF